MNYLNKVQLTADDLLKALPYKLQKGFKEGEMNDIKLFDFKVRLVDGMGKNTIGLIPAAKHKRFESIDDLVAYLAEHSVFVKNISFGNEPEIDLLVETEEAK